MTEENFQKAWIIYGGIQGTQRQIDEVAEELKKIEQDDLESIVWNITHHTHPSKEFVQDLRHAIKNGLSKELLRLEEELAKQKSEFEAI